MARTQEPWRKAGVRWLGGIVAVEAVEVGGFCFCETGAIFSLVDIVGFEWASLDEFAGLGMELTGTGPSGRETGPSGRVIGRAADDLAGATGFRGGAMGGRPIRFTDGASSSLSLVSLSLISEGMSEGREVTFLAI